MAYEYLLTTLPPLPDEPGSPLPIRANELWEIVKLEEGEVSEVAEFLLASLDIRNLEFLERGKEGAVVEAIADADDLKGRKNLPHWMTQELSAIKDMDRTYPFDRLWEGYFEQLMAFLKERGAEELQEWVRWEIGLRNALVAHRARKMGLPADAYTIAEDLGINPVEYHSIFTELKEIETENDPFAEDRFIASIMLRRLAAATPEYAFDFNEIIGYVIKFIILARVAYLAK